MSHTTSRKELSPEKRAAVEAAREMARQKPGPDDLIDQGDIDEPVPHGQFIELLALVTGLKQERERKGMSLTDVSEVSGLTRAAVSRLENGWNSNPTLDTLYRYAMSLDMHVKLSTESLPAPSEESAEPMTPNRAKAIERTREATSKKRQR